MVAYHIVAKQAGNYLLLHRNLEDHSSESIDQILLSGREMAWGISPCTGHELAEAWCNQEEHHSPHVDPVNRSIGDELQVVLFKAR